MKKVILLIVAIVVLAGAYLLLKGNTAMAPEVDDLSSGTMKEDTGGSVMVGDEESAGDSMMDEDPAVVVAYTDVGYEPKEVTVKKGETVRFVNNSSSQETWPASAVHPTHSVYPEKSASDCLGSSFDACRGLKSGESWDFTFNTVGEWKFHDHMHPSKFGSVKVTE